MDRLMQLLPEDEDGFVLIDGLADRLEEIRSGAILNALVESDPVTLRKELVVRLRKVGLLETGKLKLWELKSALVQADQICLSMMQIHVLLCLARPNVDAEGNVDVAAWAATASSVLPHMFDAKIFVDTAERLQLEAAEAQRQRENAEIAALGAAKVGAKGDGENEQAKEVEVNQEDVEKILIQLFSSGESRNGLLPAETIFTMLRNNESQVQACQLNECELTGLMAEMSPDSSGQVVYSEYVKRVVSIIFQLRHNQLLNAYLEEDAFETLGIPKPDLQQLHSIFPLYPPGWKVREAEKPNQTDGPRRSGARMSGARCSGTERVRRQSVSKEHTGEPRTRSKQVGADNEEETLRVQGRARLQVGGRTDTKRQGSKMAPVVKDTPNGRGYHRRRMLLGMMSTE
jgi:hypothetical protein